MADQEQKQSVTENAAEPRVARVENIEGSRGASVVRLATGVPAMADDAFDNMEEAAVRINAMNEEMIQSAASSGRWVLDTYEQALRTMLDFHLAAAEATQIQWVNAMARAQAQFMLEFSNFYTRAARNLLG